MAAAGSRAVVSSLQVCKVTRCGTQGIATFGQLCSCKGQLRRLAVAHSALASSLQVCKVTCCGIANFEQHCSSKRHLRKAALEAASITAAAAGAAGGRPAAPPEHRGTTYMGRQAQCRNYCKQVSCILHRPLSF